MARTIIIGDVHGCLEEFDELVLLLDVRAGDVVISLGDLVDKGPCSLGVLRRYRELATASPEIWKVISGNHEEKAVRLHELGKTSKWDEEWLKEATAKDWAFMADMPLLLRPLEGVLCVHGGVYPSFFKKYDSIGEVPATWRKGGGKRIDRMRKFLRVRHVDAEGDFVSLDDTQPEHPHWSSVYDGREGRIYFGHDPQPSGFPLLTEHAVGIDTGCVFGGTLTAAILEGDKETFLAIQAKKAYTPPYDATKE
jgi:diadenosine tetraphosphatase ApaH/serine/threonine PP2A family protein phosphatase